MNFLKTLLLYMTMTFAMTVQEAPAPGIAPQTTEVPAYIQAQSIGTATPAPEKTAAPVKTKQAAPQKTPAPTRATPTLTPNARYKTIQHGDRGSEVKKLQKRLIELGYLKAGGDDGVYGYGTLNAVRDFQKANGLNADGAAGRVTLTCLYEDPNAVSKIVTPSPVPTATPTIVPSEHSAELPALGQTAEVTAEPTAAPSVVDGWQKVERGTVLLNGDMLVLLQRVDGNITQRKPDMWLRGGVLMISLDDLVTASGEWSIQQGDINQAQMVIAGYQVMLTAVGDTATGTCEAYTAMVNGRPCLLNDGDIVCSRNHWYAAPTFFSQVAGATAVWDADEQTLVIQAVDASLANAVD